MALSAEREAQRILNKDSSEQAIAFAYAVAPWLIPDNEDNIGPDPALLANSIEAVTNAISSLDTTLEDISETIEALY